MKKGWMQIVAFVICIILAVTAVKQQNMILHLKDRAEVVTEMYAETAGKVTALEERIVVLEEEQTERVKEASIRFLNPSVNTEDRMLTIDMIAEVPEGQEASLDIGFCRVGEPYCLAWKKESLRKQEDGTYIQTTTFPLDMNMDLELRLEDDTVLFSSVSIAPLLPLQLKHGGISWHYDSQLQIFYQTDWHVEMTDPEGKTVQGAEGKFCVYRNGTLVFSGREIQNRYSVEKNGEVLDSASLPCVSGDRMRLCYICTDAFGLRYEFPITELLAMRWDDMEECPLSRYPSVDWPQ